MAFSQTKHTKSLFLKVVGARKGKVDFTCVMRWVAGVVWSRLFATLIKLETYRNALPYSNILQYVNALCLPNPHIPTHFESCRWHPEAHALQ